LKTQKENIGMNQASRWFPYDLSSLRNDEIRKD
jgi:hypothetical protein